MNREELDPEMEQLMTQVKFKEPPEKLMKDFLPGVNAKIDYGLKRSHFGFPQAAIVCAVGLALAGLAYYFFLRPQAAVPLQPAATSQVVEATGARPEAPSPEEVLSPSRPAVSKAESLLTLEEEMAVLEAFSEEEPELGVEVYPDDLVLEELASMDELEVSLSRSSA